MTGEEAIKVIRNMLAVTDLTVRGNMTGKMVEACHVAIEALKAEPCEDCVSRQALLDGLASIAKAKARSDAQKALMGRVMFFTEHLPPVTPKPMECEDCVSREAALNYIRDNYRRWFINDDAFMQCVNGIKNIVSVTPKQRTGHWKMPQNDDGMSDPIYYQVRCSECGFDLDPQTWHEELKQYGSDKFCPHCGAKMEGESE